VATVTAASHHHRRTEAIPSYRRDYETPLAGAERGWGLGLWLVQLFCPGKKQARWANEPEAVIVLAQAAVWALGRATGTWNYQ
jgi:hypothetical protein